MLRVGGETCTTDTSTDFRLGGRRGEVRERVGGEGGEREREMGRKGREERHKVTIQ